MSRDRVITGLSGVLLIDKPVGLTSHDVVGAVRRITGERRVGHAGTLDPMATGLLVVLVGPSTRLAPWLTAAEKSYEACIVFGTETDTDDAEGAVTRSADASGGLVDPGVAAEAIAALVGEHDQVPPAYSAIKVAGKTAHRVARAGGEVTLEPRKIRVFSAELLRVEPGPPIAWDVALTVSKGTYVRALARDLGRSLHTAAHLGALRRTRSGSLKVEDAITLERLAEDPTGAAALFTGSVAALGLPSVALDAGDAERVSHGSSLSGAAVFASASAAAESASGNIAATTAAPASGAVAVTRDGRLLAIYEHNGETLRPVTVLPGGVA